MASFAAQLLVAGHTYPVRQCTYEFTQATGLRGRVTEQVRMGLVQLTLDVPTDDFLLGWATTPNKPLAGQVVFLAAQGGSALETLGWETGQCVGYREEFAAGDQDAGAYVCHLTIAAPKLTIQSGGPVTSVNTASATGLVLETALLKAEELASGLVRKVITPAGELGTEILGIGAATLARTASLTAGLVLTPANDPDAPGYKSELDLGKLTQNPTQQDKTRLDYLENERQHRALSEAEEEELASLLAVVRKIFVGGRTGLGSYYGQIATEASGIDASRGGHSYAEHGAHITPPQHDTRLRTGHKPSGFTPLRPDGTPLIPDKSSSFASDAKYLETLALADRQLQTEKFNTRGGLKRKVDFDVTGATHTGTSYELDATGNMVPHPTQGAKAVYRLNPTTNDYELVTLFPK